MLLWLVMFSVEFKVCIEMIIVRHLTESETNSLTAKNRSHGAGHEQFKWLYLMRVIIIVSRRLRWHTVTPQHGMFENIIFVCFSLTEDEKMKQKMCAKKKEVKSFRYEPEHTQHNVTAISNLKWFWVYIMLAFTPGLYGPYTQKRWGNIL